MADALDLAAETTLSLMYGQSCLNNRVAPDRALFERVARQRGWTERRFNEWARERTWATPEVVDDESLS